MDHNVTYMRKLFRTPHHVHQSIPPVDVRPDVNRACPATTSRRAYQVGYQFTWIREQVNGTLTLDSITDQKSWAALVSNSMLGWSFLRLYQISFRLWVTILWKLDDNLWEIGWPYFWWLVTNLGMIGDHPGDGGWPSMGWWLTIHGMVTDHPLQLSTGLHFVSRYRCQIPSL